MLISMAGVTFSGLHDSNPSWHLDAVRGSLPPHPVYGVQQQLAIQWIFGSLVPDYDGYDRGALLPVPKSAPCSSRRTRLRFL